MDSDGKRWGCPELSRLAPEAAYRCGTCAVYTLDPGPDGRRAWALWQWTREGDETLRRLRMRRIRRELGDQAECMLAMLSAIDAEYRAWFAVERERLLLEAKARAEDPHLIRSNRHYAWR